MFLRYFWISVYLVLVTIAAESDAATCCLGAFGPLENCNPARPPCDQQIVMCPTWTTEMRTIACTTYRHETRQRQVTTYRTVTEQKPAVSVKKVMVSFPRTKIVKSVIRTPVWNCVTKPVTTMVPQTSMKTVTRMVRQTFWSCEMKTICEDHGRWERRLKQVQCGCDPCKTVTICQRVWVPCVKTRQVPVRVCRSRLVPTTCQVPCTVYVPRTCM